jgi:hypothetical protein
MKVDRRAAEGAAPLDHAGIEMRMRNGDRRDAAEALDQRHGGGVDHGDAVPQHIAAAGAQQKRALADGEGGLRADADHPRLVLPEAVEVAGGERRQGGEGLPLRRHVLPRVVADDAARRRRFGRGVLGAAGGADEGGH